MRDHRDEAGLTLVEVLVALAIIGLVAASIMGLIAQNTRFLAGVEERAIAGVLADNEMTEVLARAAPPELGDSVRETEFGGSAWFVERHVVQSGVEGLIRIEIKVRGTTRKQVAASAATLRALRE